jgi:Fe-S cluster biogenesis protein NfuA
MSIDTLDVAAGIDELRALLRADGADLELVGLDAGRRHVRVRLDLSGVDCLECVIPPDLLEDLVRDGLRRRVAADLEVVVDDPRRVVT